MLISNDIANLILIAISLLMVFLDNTISKSNNYKMSEVICYFAITIFLINNFFNFIINGFYSKDDLNFILLCSSLFISLNSFLFIRLFSLNKLNIEYGKVYFLVISHLAAVNIFLNTSYNLIKAISSIAFLIIVITLVIKTTQGSKKAEIAIKLVYISVILLISELINIFFSNILNIENINLIKSNHIININNIFIFFTIISIFCLSGIAPFHDGYINIADASNPATAFLVYSNSSIIGIFSLFKLKYQFFSDYYIDDKLLKSIITILLVSFLIISLRSIDQNKIKRTLAYIASCVTPLVFLASLIGNSLSLPNRIYIIGIYVFTTLSLFSIFASIQVMKNINNHLVTWEDIAGFGRNNILNTICLLIAIANIAGIPGTIGYFLKLSLLSYMQENLFFHILIFLSIVITTASLMRLFVFFYAKNSFLKEQDNNNFSYLLVISCFILAVLGLFPFIR